jgi:23S rRNA pseudouridine2605 synthase
MPAERLGRWLARQGIASRRGADELLRQGRVRVNLVPAPPSGQLIDPDRDLIEVDGRRIESDRGPLRYLALNKPAGVVSTVRDPGGRPTVLDLVPDGAGLFPVGRLDRDSRGLLFLTDDGELSQRLTHPRYGAPKTYRVRLAQPISRRQLQELREGPMLEDGPTHPTEVRPEARGEVLFVTLREGRNRELRRMLERVGSTVLDLERVEFAGIRLGTLPPGAVRELSRPEVGRLRREAGLR